MFGADLVLHKACGRWEKVVGGGGATDDQVNLPGRNARSLEGLPGGGHRQRGGAFAFGHDASLADTGATSDPFVGSIYQFFEVGVGEYLFGYGASPACNS